MKCSRLWALVILALSVTACGGRETAQPEPEKSPTAVEEDDVRADERERMVSSQIEMRRVVDEAVLEAMRTVPRHEFVPEEFQEMAYNDHPLPIGYGQTISQPYIVALMTQVLKPESDMRVLEIGTGSGYQAAVLAEIVDEVYTVEIIEQLATSAEERLARLGYDNVHVLRADGYNGWEEHAPYDAIIVTAAPDHMPQPLILQMADDSRLVIPIGPVGFYQELFLFTKVGGELQPAQKLLDVAFVPLTREGEQPTTP